MKQCAVSLNPSYDVMIQKGCLKRIFDFVSSFIQNKKVVVITDDNVKKYHYHTLQKSFLEHGITPLCFCFPAGEKSKNLTTYAQCLEFLATHKVQKSDVVLALGGGVVGDLSGFVCATYQRGGMCFLNIPTTPLSAFDASVGGKTGVDLSEGKNMVGAFYQPSRVICDPMTFLTNEASAFSMGAAEGIKHGLIHDATLFESFENPLMNSDLEDMVYKNVCVKAHFVEQDEKDKGIRQMLNFGHTIGHALESISNYTLPHGQAVAQGMYLEMRAARKMGLSNVHEDVLQNVFKANALDVHIKFCVEEVQKWVLLDKKHHHAQIALPVIQKVGKATLVSLNDAQLAHFIALSEKA